MCDLIHQFDWQEVVEEAHNYTNVERIREAFAGVGKDVLEALAQGHVKILEGVWNAVDAWREEACRENEDAAELLREFSRVYAELETQLARTYLLLGLAAAKE